MRKKLSGHSLSEKKEQYAQAVDFVAGFLGLRVHKLLVGTLIRAQGYIYKTNLAVFSTQSETNIRVTDEFNWDPEGEWITDFAKAGIADLMTRRVGSII